MRHLLLRSGSFSSNTIANLVGRLLPGVLTIAVVPLLLPLLGSEGYGVVGLYATFLIVFATLEVGLTITATRQIARNLAFRAGTEANRKLLRTLEVVYWGVGMVIALALAASASSIADLVNAHAIEQPEVRDAIAAGGIAIALRWPISLYAGILNGVQLQVTQNAVTVGAAILRIVGALPFVAWIYPSVVGFMLWQAFASAIELAAMGFFAWRTVGGLATRVHFDKRILQALWRLAAGLTVIGLLGAVLTQADRLVIGSRLPLEELGYYTLAMTAAGPLPLMAAAVAAAALPRFAGQLARTQSDALARTYHQAFDVTAYIAVWAALPLIFFSHEILFLWTRSGQVANSADAVLTLLALAFLLNALYAIPYTLVLAAGRTKIPLIVNGLSVPIVVAVTYVLVPSLGLVGAAAIWLAVMGVHFAVYGTWVHRALLPGRFIASLTRPARYAVAGLVLFSVARTIASYVGNEGLAYGIALLAVIMSALVGIWLWPSNLRGVLPTSLARRPGRGDEGFEEAVPMVPEGAIQPKA